MARIRYADQKLPCLQWKCGLGLKMTLSVDARRGSTPCHWAFPGVLFIIKKCWNEIFGNFEKEIILTTKTIPTMQRNKKTFKGQNIYIGICPQQTKRTVPLVCGLKKSCPHQTTCNALVYIGLMRTWSFTSLPLYLGLFAAWDAAKRYSITCPCKLYFTPFLLITSWPFSIILTGLPASWSASIELIPVGSVKP